jgi:hypothetical protein
VRGQRHALAALYPPEKNPVSIVQEAGWASGPAWTGAENLAPTGIRFPDRPARSQSLYRLRYPAHQSLEYSTEKQACTEPQCLYKGDLYPYSPLSHVRKFSYIYARTVATYDILETYFLYIVTGYVIYSRGTFHEILLGLI